MHKSTHSRPCLKGANRSLSDQMVVALWDIAAKAANLAQLLGLDAVTLIAIAMSFLRFRQAKKECRKLEGRVRMLRALLSSVGGRWITQQHQQNDDDLELAAGQQLQVASVLRDATDLVESYKRRSLYARVRGGRGMATRFRDLRSHVDSCCRLILAVNAFLLVVQPPNQLNHPPPSLVRRTEGNDDDVGVPPSAGDSVHHAAAEPSSSTTAPDDTHVIDITPARQE